MVDGSSPKQLRRKFRARPKWGGRPGPSWQPKYDKQRKAKEIPHIATRSRSYNNAAVERHEDGVTRGLVQAAGIAAFFNRIFNRIWERLKPKFTLPPAPSEYRIEVQ